uniref:NADH-ubiquinone oxidoreductase chain 4 n=1 Tax=Bemisia afer TaxID=166114 RepID=A0A0U2GTE8_BEMAF|nr:NADH dehydrogenase subunit 4 [Bemisia afer]
MYNNHKIMKMVMPIMMMMLTNSPNQNLFSLSILITLFNVNLQKLEITKLSYMMMGDELSFWTTNLALWLTFILMMMKTNYKTYYTKMLFSTLMTFILTFYTWNFMMFYFMFEMSMILILLIIMMWGYQPERVEAVMFMIVMTVVVSLPFLASMMNNLNSLNFWMMQETSITIWDYVSFMIIFMMKMPTVFLHMWLPKIHVESPIQGSMVLASVMLKLGSYGMIRTTGFTMLLNMKYAFLILAFTMWTIILMSAVCLTQTDLKTLIAYSSIVHMTTVFSTIILNKSKGMLGTVAIILGHGMCSSGLFYLANFMYKITKSRSVIINKGAMILSPTFCIMWFSLCMSNTPMPPSINLLGEFMAFKTATNWSWIIMLMVIPIIFISSFYSIYLFYLPTHSIYTKSTMKINILTSKSLNIVMLHIMPMILLMTKPQMIMI